MAYRKCENYLDENAPGYVVEYRGDFDGQIDKVDYACGNIITDTLAVVSVQEKDIDRLMREVPAIIFIETRTLYVLQDLSPSDVDGINQLKTNAYLNLTGRGVVVGIIDTGINYLNREFIREDDTSRILGIWDQSIQSDTQSQYYIGTIYSNEEINRAIQANLKGENPYDIVPSRDVIGHGTQMAGIIGARGYNGQMTGVANDCDFLVVKLLESPNYKKILRENNLPDVPVYNSSEVLSAIEYLRNMSNILRRPLVVYLGVGSTDGSHDGYNITARHITALASRGGTVYVVGTGNQGNSEGHTVGFIENEGGIDTAELLVPKELKSFTLYIWIEKPNRMSISIVSPNGEDTGFLVNQIKSINNRTFYLINTDLEVRGYDPESLTGHQLYSLKFTDIKPGIWKFRLKGQNLTNGRYDIWLPPREILPQGMKFLRPVSENTLTIPSTARNTVAVAYFDGLTKALLAESGKGFNVNKIVRPDIATVGTNVLTISTDGNRVISVQGSSVATAIVAGACALFVQWALVDQNDITVSSGKVRSLLIYAADRENQVLYPNVDVGYGRLNILEVFNILGGTYRSIEDDKEEYQEMYMGNLYIRIPKYMAMKKGEE